MDWYCTYFNKECVTFNFLWELVSVKESDNSIRASCSLISLGYPHLAGQEKSLQTDSLLKKDLL